MTAAHTSIPFSARHMHFNAKANSISINNLPGIFQIKTRLYILGMVIINIHESNIIPVP